MDFPNQISILVKQIFKIKKIQISVLLITQIFQLTESALTCIWSCHWWRNSLSTKPVFSIHVDVIFFFPL